MKKHYSQAEAFGPSACSPSRKGLETGNNGVPDVHSPSVTLSNHTILGNRSYNDLGSRHHLSRTPVVGTMAV